MKNMRCNSISDVKIRYDMQDNHIYMQVKNDIHGE